MRTDARIIVRALVVLAIAGTGIAVGPKAHADFCPMEPVPEGTLRSYESELVSRLNSERSSRGLGRVRVDGEIASIARNHARKMAAEGRVFHNPGYQDAGRFGARQIGEVAGSGCSVGDVHQGLMGSGAHRSTMMQSVWTRVGIGVASDEAGKLYVVEDFADDAAAAAPAPAPQQPAPPKAAAPAKTPKVTQASAAPARPAAAPQRPTRRTRAATAEAPPAQAEAAPATVEAGAVDFEVIAAPPTTEAQAAAPAGAEDDRTATAMAVTVLVLWALVWAVFSPSPRTRTAGAAPQLRAAVPTRRSSSPGPRRRSGRAGGQA